MLGIQLNQFWLQIFQNRIFDNFFVCLCGCFCMYMPVSHVVCTLRLFFSRVDKLHTMVKQNPPKMDMR